MARTIAVIYNALISEKETFSTLSGLAPVGDTYTTFLRDLNTTSKAAVWRMLLYVVAVGIHIQEVYYGLFIEELEALRPTLIAGTDQWYIDQAKEFQLGDALTWNGSQFVYATDDATKKIVTFSAAETVGNVLNLKVAKGTTPTKLSAGELSAFTAYANEIGFAGTEINVISTDGDQLWLEANCYVNPLLINLDGTSVADASLVVEDALNSYLANLNFNGVFSLFELYNYMNSISGVTNFVVTVGNVKAATSLAYTDLLITSSRSYVPYAGYLIEDPVNPYNITYYASV